MFWCVSCIRRFNHGLIIATVLWKYSTALGAEEYSYQSLKIHQTRCFNQSFLSPKHKTPGRDSSKGAYQRRSVAATGRGCCVLVLDKIFLKPHQRCGCPQPQWPEGCCGILQARFVWIIFCFVLFSEIFHWRVRKCPTIPKPEAAKKLLLHGKQSGNTSHTRDTAKRWSIPSGNIPSGQKWQGDPHRPPSFQPSGLKQRANQSMFHRHDYINLNDAPRQSHCPASRLHHHLAEQAIKTLPTRPGMSRLVLFFRKGNKD